MKVDIRNKKQLALLIIIALTLLFIFGQSALPPSKSMEESDGVAEAFDNILDPSGSSDSGEDGESKAQKGAFASFIITNLRKIAHFVEHGALGLEIFLLICLAEKDSKKKRFMPITLSSLLLSLNIGILVGFVDESIQILSGRDAKMLDVWLDFSGYLTFTVLALLTAITVNAIKNRSESKKQS